MDKNKSFEWKTGETRRVFPIDYSAKEFAEEFDIPVKRVYRYLTSKTWYRDFLKELIMKDKEELPPDYFGKAPITLPIETIPLLEQYLKTIGRKYSKYFSEKPCEMGENTREEFLGEFF